MIVRSIMTWKCDCQKICHNMTRFCNVCESKSCKSRKCHRMTRMKTTSSRTWSSKFVSSNKSMIATFERLFESSLWNVLQRCWKTKLQRKKICRKQRTFDQEIISTSSILFNQWATTIQSSLSLCLMSWCKMWIRVKSSLLASLNFKSSSTSKRSKRRETIKEFEINHNEWVKLCVRCRMRKVLLKAFFISKWKSNFWTCWDCVRKSTKLFFVSWTTTKQRQ